MCDDMRAVWGCLYCGVSQVEVVFRVTYGGEECFCLVKPLLERKMKEACGDARGLIMHGRYGKGGLSLH